jgi:hypothetical protein
VGPNGVDTASLSFPKCENTLGAAPDREGEPPPCVKPPRAPHSPPAQLTAALTARIDGPYADTDTVAAADLTAETIRYLNHAVQPRRSPGRHHRARNRQHRRRQPGRQRLPASPAPHPARRMARRRDRRRPYRRRLPAPRLATRGRRPRPPMGSHRARRTPRQRPQRRRQHHRDPPHGQPHRSLIPRQRVPASAIAVGGTAARLAACTVGTAGTAPSAVRPRGKKNPNP